MPIVLEKGSKINLTKKDTKKVGKININFINYKMSIIILC